MSINKSPELMIPPIEPDEKRASDFVNSSSGEDELEYGHGHLQELEVDVERVIREEREEDIDGDESPYPEGNSLFLSTKIFY
jgi:hypothetical protein